MLQLIFLPPLIALALCIHLGYAFSKLALPTELQPYRLLLTPLIGFALFLTAASTLTVFTALTPPQIAIGLVILAVPVNVWAFWCARSLTLPPLPFLKERSAMECAPQPKASPSSASWPLIPAILLAALVFLLAILPLLSWGLSVPIGSNWDAAEVYVPIARALQLRSQRDIPLIPRNPLVDTFTSPPNSGRIHSFSYLHAAVSSAASCEPYASFAPLMAF